MGLFADRKAECSPPRNGACLLRSERSRRQLDLPEHGLQGVFLERPWRYPTAPVGCRFGEGSMYRSADDGNSWNTESRLQSKSSITAFTQAGADVTAVGLDGLVLRSSDGGESFKATVSR